MKKIPETSHNLTDIGRRPGGTGRGCNCCKSFDNGELKWVNISNKDKNCLRNHKIGYASETCWSRNRAGGDVGKKTSDRMVKMMQIGTWYTCFDVVQYVKNVEMQVFLDEECDDEHVLDVNKR